jgi:hypothetical protein
MTAKDSEEQHHLEGKVGKGRIKAESFLPLLSLATPQLAHTSTHSPYQYIQPQLSLKIYLDTA